MFLIIMPNHFHNQEINAFDFAQAPMSGWCLSEIPANCAGGRVCPPNKRRRPKIN
jgi:hypothetical protein